MALAMVTLFVVVVLTAVFFKRAYYKNTNRKCESNKSLYGKTAIVTGGTTGIGIEVATDFAHRGAKVIIACPFQEEGINARKTIINKTGNEKVIFKHLDLASLKSVRSFAEDIINTEDRLHILINNAGVAIPNDTTTPDGMSFIMQVNYFGHFLLTLLLLPLLKRSGEEGDPSRIVNTSSIAHTIGRADFVFKNRKNFLFKILVYANSKFTFIPCSRALAKKLRETNANVVVNCIDPGLVSTKIYESVNKTVGLIFILTFNFLFKTPYGGAQTTIYAAVDPAAGNVSGEFFRNSKQSHAVPWAYSDDLADRVWKDSVKLVKLTEEELMKCLEN